MPMHEWTVVTERGLDMPRAALQPGRVFLAPLADFFRAIPDADLSAYLETALQGSGAGCNDVGFQTLEWTPWLVQVGSLRKVIRIPRATFLLAFHAVAARTLQIHRPDGVGGAEQPVPPIWLRLLARGLEALQPLADLDVALAQMDEQHLRLLACALMRQAWHRLADERSRAAVEVSERFAVSLAAPEELHAARLGAESAYAGLDPGLPCADREAAWTASLAASLTRPADAVRTRFLAGSLAVGPVAGKQPPSRLHLHAG
jgi:hypothetical protein